MGNYHNRLNKRSFKNSVYINKFEQVFNIKITKYPIQYELIFETLNTYIDINNILFSKKYIPVNTKIDKMITLIDSYVNKYKNKINKCYDLNCIDMFETFICYNNELKEMKELETLRKAKKEKYSKINLKSISARVEMTTLMLDLLEIDNLYDSKGMTYEKQVNEKIPKKYACKLFTEEEIEDNLIFNNNKLQVINNNFIYNYLDKTNIDLNSDKEQKNFIITIHKKIMILNNAFVDYYTYKDMTTLNITKLDILNFLKTNVSFVKDITYTTLFNKLNLIADDIVNNNLDNAFNKLKHIIDNDNMNLYERIS